MTILLYDGSFEGLLTAVFYVFEYRLTSAKLSEDSPTRLPDLFAEEMQVYTDTGKADRVLKKLRQIVGVQGIRQILHIYLSSDPEKENILLEVITQAVKNPSQNILENLALPCVLQAHKISRAVGQEAHRMKGFLRFEALQDGSFFAPMEPVHNILPLLKSHFTQRFASQTWLIFDQVRAYGLFYNQQEATFFFPTEDFLSKPAPSQLHPDEEKYQSLWKRYFKKATLTERRNLRLHTQSLPKRYWKYLTEKG